MLNFEAFLEWVLIKEPTLRDIEKDPPVSDYTKAQLEIGFNDAFCRCQGVRSYMRECNFETLVYNYALHIAIMNAIPIDEIVHPLQAINSKYFAKDSVIGITTSASSGGSSASTTLPKIISEGDMETVYLINTPYGIQVELIFESLGGMTII